MSWNFDFVASDKTEAKQKVAEHETNLGIHFPGSVSTAVVAAIDMLPDNAAADVFVKTYGHIDDPTYGSNGNGLIEVKTVPRPAPPASDENEALA